MNLKNTSTLVTGGASGLGLACAEHLLSAGAKVLIVDLPSSNGKQVADQLGEAASFVPADITEPEQMAAAIAAAEENGPLRGVVHCAGHGGAVRLVEKDGMAGRARRTVDQMEEPRHIRPARPLLCHR